jgi:hypothetical protein
MGTFRGIHTLTTHPSRPRRKDRSFGGKHLFFISKLPGNNPDPPSKSIPRCISAIRHRRSGPVTFRRFPHSLCSGCRWIVVHTARFGGRRWAGRGDPDPSRLSMVGFVGGRQRCSGMDTSSDSLGESTAEAAVSLGCWTWTRWKSVLHRRSERRWIRSHFHRCLGVRSAHGGISTTLPSPHWDLPPYVGLTAQRYLSGSRRAFNFLHHREPSGSAFGHDIRPRYQRPRFQLGRKERRWCSPWPKRRESHFERQRDRGISIRRCRRQPDRSIWGWVDAEL